MQQVLVVYRYLPHDVQFFLTFTSLLPILVISIRWKSHFGDTSQIGTTLTTWIFHLTNAALLVVCVWATFDTGFSLRDPEGKFPMIASNRDRLLPLYFLSALSIGYLSGYFLLVFRPLPQRLRRPSALQKFLSRLPEAAVWALMFLAPAGLLYKNIPQISVTNGPALCRYAAALTEKLPPHGSVVLSDRPDSLMLAEAWLARSGKSKDFVFLETHSLKFPAYYWFEKAKHPLVWPTLTTNVYREDLFTDRALVYLLTQLSASNSIYYLHPSFGAYFERFYAIPHGLVYELKEYPTNGPVFAPPLADAVLAENENFWKGHEPAFRELLAAVAPPKPTQDPTLRQRFMDRLHIPFERNSGAFRLGVIYSQALNTLGGYEQRMGRLEAAGKHFQAAHEFFPDNVVAAANLDFNTKLRSGERIVAQTPESFEERFGKFSNWESILDVNGLFDDATGCLAQGIVFARGGMKRQPAQQFERVLSLAPDSPLAKLWLARMYVLLQTPDKALTLTSDLKAHSDSLADAAITPADVFTVELSAAYASSQEKATRLLQETISRRSPETNVLDRAAQISIAVHDYTNALAVVDKQLSLNPANSGDRVNRGYIELQLGNFSKSIETLSQVISLEPTNFAALFDRALANMRNGNLDDSRKDYEALLKLNPRSSVVYYGLGEVALQQKNTNAAIGYYQASQSNAPPNSVEFQFVSNRLSSLKNHSP
jgi:tetratricopeptide (TPR) repeat protein